MAALGDCFPVAFRLLFDNADYLLCHGTVVRQEDGLHHQHAWVERTVTTMFPMLDGTEVPLVITTAIDRSNGLDVELPADFYRKLGQAYDVSVYTYAQASILAINSGHYGPW